MMGRWSRETIPADHYLVIGEERHETMGSVGISHSSVMTDISNLEMVPEDREQ
jgi:hypothetical protein